MSYSSAFNVVYTPNQAYEVAGNKCLFPLLNNTNVADIVATVAGNLTNSATGGVAVPLQVSSINLSTGNYAIRFQVSLTIAGAVTPTNIYGTISPEGGTVVNAITCFMFVPVAMTAGTYQFNMETVIQITGPASLPTTLSITGFWVGAGTVGVSSDVSFVKIT